MNNYLRNSHTSSDPVVQPIHTAVKGRARFKVNALHRSQSLKQYIELNLKDEEGIRDVFANPVTGSVLVTFQPNFSPRAIALLIKDIVLYFQGQGRKSLTKTSVVSPTKSSAKDLCDEPSKSSHLQQGVDKNLSNRIIAPTTSTQFADALDVVVGSSIVFPAQEACTSRDKRMYIIEVIARSINTKVPVRRSRELYTVPFEQLGRRYQEIHNRGGKIISVNAV
jgi:CpcD/allophycocyanin linker domain/Heavy metal associated domain 2